MPAPLALARGVGVARCMAHRDEVFGIRKQRPSELRTDKASNARADRGVKASGMRHRHDTYKDATPHAEHKAPSSRPCPLLPLDDKAICPRVVWLTRIRGASPASGCTATTLGTEHLAAALESVQPVLAARMSVQGHLASGTPTCRATADDSMRAQTSARCRRSARGSCTKAEAADAATPPTPRVAALPPRPPTLVQRPQS